jgi:hypothetical protein
MRAVVAIPDNRARERIAGFLQAHGDDVHAIDTFPLSAEEVHLHNPDLVICLARDIGAVRSYNVQRQPFVIAALPLVNDQSVNEAVAAKADDFLPATACAAEVIARAELSQRWATLREGRSADAIQRLQVWQDAPTMLSQDVGALFGVFMYPVAFDPEREGHAPDIAATISVTASVEETVIRLTVGISQAEADRLGSHAFGGPVDETVVRDALREIANNVAGSLKRAALTEGVTVTLGLPSDCRAEDVRSAARVWVAECEQFRLSIGMSKGAQSTLRVRASDLEPGMVLKHDIRSSAGAALVRAGTALTERTAARLLEYCEPSAIVDVVRPEG